MTSDDVEDHQRPGVADVKQVVNRRPADVHPHLARVHGTSGTFFCCCESKMLRVGSVAAAGPWPEGARRQVLQAEEG